jgi:hypothetical protein
MNACHQKGRAKQQHDPSVQLAQIEWEGVSGYPTSSMQTPLSLNFHKFYSYSDKSARHDLRHQIH